MPKVLFIALAAFFAIGLFLTAQRTACLNEELKSIKSSRRDGVTEAA